MKRVRPLEWLLIGVLVLLLGAIFWPVHTVDRVSRKGTCLSNVKQLGLATMIYAGDADERYPLRDAWMDALVPYTKNESIYHCPVVPKGTYGYALDSRRSGAKPPPDPARAPLIFESANPIRNASDPLLSLPNPGRHPGRAEGGDMGRNSVAYADGHAKVVLGGVVP